MINNLLFMNKILILLSLIYLVSCKLACSSFSVTPEKREDCYNRALKNEDNGICCFLSYSSPSFGNYSICQEFDTKTNTEFVKLWLIAKYSQNNMTIEDFSCPTKEKSDDSSKEDDSSSKNCTGGMDEKNYKNCFSKTVVDETNNYCCFALMSINEEKQGGCKEFQKNISLNDIKQELDNQYSKLGMKLEDLKCPSNEEEKENSPQGNTSNKGFYIKSGFALIFAFLF